VDAEVTSSTSKFQLENMLQQQPLSAGILNIRSNWSPARYGGGLYNAPFGVIST
jgi:hypothetical protein